VVQVLSPIFAGLDFLSRKGDESTVIEAHEAGKHVTCKSRVGHFPKFEILIVIDQPDRADEIGRYV